jgi:hypothetical protein
VQPQAQPRLRVSRRLERRVRVVWRRRELRVQSGPLLEPVRPIQVQATPTSAKGTEPT